MGRAESPLIPYGIFILSLYGSVSVNAILQVTTRDADTEIVAVPLYSVVSPVTVFKSASVISTTRFDAVKVIIKGSLCI